MGKTEMISSGDEQRRPIAFYYGPRFFIDGKEIEMVISVEFHHPSDDVATLMFKTVGRPIIKTLGKVAFDFSPENLSDACLIVS